MTCKISKIRRLYNLIKKTPIKVYSYFLQTSIFLRRNEFNKTELVAAVAEETGKSKADVKEILEALIAQVVKTVKAGDEIALIGFGTFKSAERAARTGRNPATGKEIKIPASVQPKFIAGKLFKEAVNSK